MGRLILFAVTAVLAALVSAGCGAPVATDAAPSAAAAGPATVEVTDGRLGSATTVRVGSRPRELTPGGRLDVAPREDGARRDGVGAGAACAGADTAPAPAALPAVVEVTLCLLNGERADRGLPPLASDDRLTAAATAYAQDLVDGGYFSHTGRDGSGVLERIERTGYIPRNSAWQVGENLAWGTGALATPGSIVRAWMNSPGHRENILNPAYREIGVGVSAGNPAAHDGAGATYATAFGVIEDDAASAGAPSARGKRAGRRGRRAARRARARVSRHQGKGRAKAKARLKRRGPLARIAV